MKKYITEYDKELLKKHDKEINNKLDISIEFDENIQKLCDEMKKEEKVIKKPWKISRIAAVIGIAFLTITGAGVVTNAATGGRVAEILRHISGAELVTDENRDLIGKEIVSDEIIITDEEKFTTEETDTESTQEIEQILADSSIVQEIDEDMLLPHSIDEVQIKAGKIPEIIMTNGAAIIFCQEDYEGWKCNEGETLVFEFEKYESEVVEEQTVVVGYVRDGVMYEYKEVFRGLEGRYELGIKEDGEYFIYAVSATSDYLTLKSGEISIKSSEK